MKPKSLAGRELLNIALQILPGLLASGHYTYPPSLKEELYPEIIKRKVSHYSVAVDEAIMMAVELHGRTVLEWGLNERKKLQSH